MNPIDHPLRRSLHLAQRPMPTCAATVTGRRADTASGGHDRLWAWAARLLSVALVAVILAPADLSPWLTLGRHGPELAYLALAGIGLLTGLVSGLLGIGGALIILPSLHLILPFLGVAEGLVSQGAAGTSLAAMLPMALTAALSQYRRGGLSADWLRRLGPGVTFGAAAGALLAFHLHGLVLMLLFAAQAICYGWGLVRAPRAAAAQSGLPKARLSRAIGYWPGWLVGMLAAGFSACAGMGATTLLIPYLSAQGIALRMASATSGALNVGVAASGVLLFALAAAHDGGGPCWPAAVLLGACAALTAPCGVALAHRLPLHLFRRTLGVVSMLGALILLTKALWA